MSDQPDFGAFQMPQEIVDAMQKMQDMNEMSGQAIRHEIAALFAELSKDHLHALRMLLSTFANVQPRKSVLLSSYYEGIAVATIQSRFNVCPGCGENHNEIMMDELAGAKPLEKPSEPPHPTLADGSKEFEGGTEIQPGLYFFKGKVPASKGSKDKPIPHIEGQMTIFDMPGVNDMSAEEAIEAYDVMQEYGLSASIGERGGVQYNCNNCGQLYQSLEDRKLKKPGKEGCEGCIQKEKWG